MKTIRELTAKLAQGVDDLLTGDLTTEKGNTLASMAGKLLIAQRTEIEYAKSRGETPDIPFMNAK